jgi:hypothetical protein
MEALIRGTGTVQSTSAGRYGNDDAKPSGARRLAIPAAASRPRDG